MPEQNTTGLSAREQRALSQLRRRNAMVINYPALHEQFKLMRRAGEYERLRRLHGEAYAARHLPMPTGVDELAAQEAAANLLLRAGEIEANVIKGMKDDKPGQTLDYLLDYFEAIHGNRSAATGTTAAARIRQDGALAREATAALRELDEADNAALTGAGTMGNLISMSELLPEEGTRLADHDASRAAPFTELYDSVILGAPNEDQAIIRLQKLSNITGYDAPTLMTWAAKGAGDEQRARSILEQRGRMSEAMKARTAHRAQWSRAAENAILNYRNTWASTGAPPEVTNLLNNLFGPILSGRGMEDMSEEDLDRMMVALGLAGGMDAMPENATTAQIREIAKNMTTFAPSLSLKKAQEYVEELLRGETEAAQEFHRWAGELGYDVQAAPRETLRMAADAFDQMRRGSNEYNEAKWAYNVLNHRIPARPRDWVKALWIRGREFLDWWDGNDYAMVSADMTGRSVEEVRFEELRQIEEAKKQAGAQADNPAAIGVAVTPEVPANVNAAVQEGEGTNLTDQEVANTVPAVVEGTPAETGTPAVAGTPGEAATPAGFDPASVPNMAELQTAARELRDEGAFGTKLAEGEDLANDDIVDYVAAQFEGTPREAVKWALQNPDGGRTGTDGWADYTLHADGRITFTHPRTGREVTVTENQPGAYWGIREKAFGEQLSGQQRTAVARSRALQSQRKERRRKEIDPNNPYWPPGVPTRAEVWRGGLSDREMQLHNDWMGKLVNAPGVSGSEEWMKWAKEQPEFIGTNLGMSEQEWDAHWEAELAESTKEAEDARIQAEAGGRLSQGMMAQTPTEFDKIMSLVAFYRDNPEMGADTPLHPYESDRAKAIRRGFYGERMSTRGINENTTSKATPWYGGLPKGYPAPGNVAYVLDAGETDARKRERIARKIYEGGIERTKEFGVGEGIANYIMTGGPIPYWLSAGQFKGGLGRGDTDTTAMEMIAGLLEEHGTTNPELHPGLEMALRIYKPELANQYFGFDPTRSRKDRKDALLYPTPGENQIGLESISEGFAPDPTNAPEGETADPAPVEATEETVEEVAEESEEKRDPFASDWLPEGVAAPKETPLAPSPAPAELAPKLETEGQPPPSGGGDPFAGLTSGDGAEVVPPVGPTPGPAGDQMPTEQDMAGTPPKQFYKPEEGAPPPAPTGPPGPGEVHPGAPPKEEGVDYGGSPPGGPPPADAADQPPSQVGAASSAQPAGTISEETAEEKRKREEEEEKKKGGSGARMPTEDEFSRAEGEPQQDSFAGLSAQPKSAPGVTAFEAQSHGIKPHSTSAQAAFPPGMAMATGPTGSATSPRARYSQALRESIARTMMEKQQQEQPVVG